MDYKKVGIQVLELVGGAKNISKLTHCATRLRFEFNDMERVEVEKIKKLPGVISVVNKGGQFQVVIGNDVQTAYRAILNASGNISGTKSNSVKNNKQKESIVSRFISVISTTFTPMIPAITGAGMIKAVLAILTLTGVLNDKSQTYYLLNTIADAAFFFMPVLLAYGAAIKFECSIILAITVAGVLLHPNLTTLMASKESVHFMGLPVKLTDYAGSVLPIIITVWIMSYIERFAERVSPSIIKFFTKPLIILLLTAPLALIVIGPFGTYLNDLVAAGAEAINSKASWLIPFLMGALQPFLVVTGTAWAMTPIATMQLTNKGAEMINGPGMLASNIAQGAATLCVAVKSKNKNLKQLAGSAGVTALLGITEPSLYGVTLKLKKPLIAAMIGGGCAGIYAGLSGLVRYAFVSPGLTALPAFIGKNPMNIVHALITCAIAFVVTFALTWIIGFEDIIEEKEEETIEKVTNEINLENNKIIEIASPLSGELIPLSKVNDDVFSGGLLGKGMAIIPDKGTVVAPIEGKIATVLESKHAIAIQSDSGLEILIHIGLDTVNLEGKHYTAFVKTGDRVKVGDKLIEFDIEEIKEIGYDIVTPIVICNSDKYKDIVGYEEKKVSFGEGIIKITN
ncbi:PTS system beta-glucoside-specific IIA component, Glc family /PTS system beta-glucoside-specific IIB component, Glc family /PTS system beta-glucoside-specific IIC component, Glc family [Clostridium cavendishii DSM 21758]|uniref:PTS system beta-glucoside-specific IIA component, Glc family /PTS system beta-glucoside-specific IIB component, Glc family /PTS system beta-glucoside-specific IIC component, Glc family n=1 Tax=Clostridium cavendishii DSM 21758 TaxID=1121302 RepID=A0A1M6NIF8_9CLOT|nr:beta-glucoside-specific PTS transporter subunit IIABC [Clostridium cavendishii]SHJ95460.1 PTS system beta-glucoside-specific IIA component, Glc family /PTS system beta-glucoside-specific IIB component, Glc family /PTS system beta-glucoside-specific IIC component, Glc family [Clostridium cavendishii DSM 21758]